MNVTRARVRRIICSPSRASFLTGTYPARHGVKLTLTTADLQPDPRYLPWVIKEVTRLTASGDVPVLRLPAKG